MTSPTQEEPEPQKDQQRQQPSADSQLLTGLPYMSTRSQEFVRSSLSAWQQLPEAERRLPTSF